MTEHFYQRYMWFLSLLLLFYILLWLLNAIWRRWDRSPREPVQEQTTPSRSIYRTLVLIGLLNIVLFAAAKFLLSSPADPFDFVWYSLGNLIQFKAAKLAFYVPYYGLGIYAYTRKWFGHRRDFGMP